jgi:hypothetical protein
MMSSRPLFVWFPFIINKNRYNDGYYQSGG